MIDTQYENIAFSNAEKQLFIPSCGDNLYSIVYSPPEYSPESKYTVVVCRPLLEGSAYILAEQFLGNLARYLASNGCNVIKFHYRGVGDSDGNWEDYTCNDYVQDIDNILAEAQGSIVPSNTKKVVVGLFFGGNLSLSSLVGNDRYDGGILINPVHSVDSYVQYLFKFVISRMFFSQHNRRLLNNTIIMQELEEGKIVDILGHPISKGYHDSLFEHEISTNLHKTEKPFMIMNCGKIPFCDSSHSYGQVSPCFHETSMMPEMPFLNNGTIETYYPDIYKVILDWLQLLERN